MSSEEVEAVARALAVLGGDAGFEARYEEDAQVAIAALDAVRERSPQGEDHEAGKWWGIHVCPRCGTRVEWRGEDPPACGMHFPDKVLAEYVEVVPRPSPAGGTEPDIPGITSCIDCGRRLVRGECPVCEADLGTEPDTQKEDAEAYRRVCEALRPYWLQQESMPAEEAVRRLVADTAKLVAENERLRIWQKAYAKGRAGLVEQADQDFACAEKAEADTAKLVEALRYLIERIDREFASSDRAPELDFVVMAANEVRHLAGFSVDAGKEQ